MAAGAGATLSGLDDETGPVDSMVIQVGRPGMDVLREVVLAREVFPGARVMVISGYVDHYLVEQLTECGASAVVSTDVALAAVFDVLVTAGPVGAEHWSSHHHAAELAEAFGVTGCELEVLHHLSEGRSPQQIARDIVTTVGMHLKSLCQKLGCSSAVQLIVTGHRLGLLPNLVPARRGSTSGRGRRGTRGDPGPPGTCPGGATGWR